MPTNHDETLQERYEREHHQMENRIAEPEAVRLNAQAVPDEPDWRHPKIQGLIGSEARLRIAIDLIWQILEDPNQEFTASDMEYWDTIHDDLKAALSAAPAAPQPAQPAQPAQPLDLGVMELAESVGLIGPESRTDDLHEAIQRFHDLIVVNASIKAARHFADGLEQQPLTFAGVAKRKLDDLKAQGYSVVGYMLARPEADHTVTRGAIDTGGMVIWWNQQKASQPNG